MTMITPSYLGETIEYSSLHACRSTLEDPTERTVVLNAMFHNVEVIAGASPYAATEDEAQRIVDRLEALLAWAQREGIPGVTLGEVPERLGAGRRAGG